MPSVSGLPACEGRAWGFVGGWEGAQGLAPGDVPHGVTLCGRSGAVADSVGNVLRAME